MGCKLKKQEHINWQANHQLNAVDLMDAKNTIYRLTLLA